MRLLFPPLCRILIFSTAALWSAAAPLTKGPYLQAPATDGMTIMWETVVPDPGRVQFGEGEQRDRSVGPITPIAVQSETQTFYLYAARLTGLKPATHYTYAVEAGSDQVAARSFTTFGATSGQTTFIAYGDSRTHPENHAKIAAQFSRHAPAFIVHTGDLVAKGTEYGLWAREFFDPLKDVIDRTPLLPAIGNHERDGANYRAYFPQPGKEQCYYSFDVGPVHVLTLDYRSTKATDPQFSFVEADLKASRAPWKIVLLHYPVFNLGSHATLWGHEDYLPLFRATKVDLTIGGHSHLYERFRPLVPKGQPDAWPMVHLTTGGGGAPLSPAVPDPSLARTLSTFHYIVLTATPELLTGRCIDIDGTEVDTFQIRKGAAIPPAELAAEEDVVRRNQSLPRKKKEKAE
jgi:acid phosphatase type 7